MESILRSWHTSSDVLQATAISTRCASVLKIVIATESVVQTCAASSEWAQQAQQAACTAWSCCRYFWSGSLPGYHQSQPMMQLCKQAKMFLSEALSNPSICLL